MPDLTLYEISELKEEEIKTRLLEDYNFITKRNNSPDDRVSSGTESQKNMKLIWQNIKTYITEQLKPILLKKKTFSPLK